MNRTARRFPGVYWDSLVTILAASFLVTGFALVGVLRMEPWFDPQHLIPLLGNALNGISLGLDRFMEGCARDRARIESLLAYRKLFDERHRRRSERLRRVE